MTVPFKNQLRNHHHLPLRTQNPPSILNDLNENDDVLTRIFTMTRVQPKQKENSECVCIAISRLLRHIPP